MKNHSPNVSANQSNEEEEKVQNGSQAQEKQSISKLEPTASPKPSKVDESKLSETISRKSEEVRTNSTINEKVPVETSMVDSIIPTEDVLDVEENDTKTSTDAFPSLTSTRDMQPQNTDYTNTLKNCKNAKQMPDKMPSKQNGTEFRRLIENQEKMINSLEIIQKRLECVEMIVNSLCQIAGEDLRLKLERKLFIGEIEKLKCDLQMSRSENLHLMKIKEKMMETAGLQDETDSDTDTGNKENNDKFQEAEDNNTNLAPCKDSRTESSKCGDRTGAYHICCEWSGSTKNKTKLLNQNPGGNQVCKECNGSRAKARPNSSSAENKKKSPNYNSGTNQACTECNGSRAKSRPNSDSEENKKGKRNPEDVFRELFKVSSDLMDDLCSEQSVDDGTFGGGTDTWLHDMTNSTTNFKISTPTCEPCLKKKHQGCK